MLIGGGGVKRTLKLVARHGDIWHAFGDIDVFTEKNEILEGHCADEGRDEPRSSARGSANGDDATRSSRPASPTSSWASAAASRATTSRALRELVAWRDAL